MVAEGSTIVQLTGLMPKAKYTVRGYLEYENGTVYSEEMSFETKPRTIPDLSGTWYFFQQYLAKENLVLDMKFSSKTADSVTYHTDPIYAGATVLMTVYSDLRVRIRIALPNDSGSGEFEGVFDEDFTSVSGTEYLYAFSSSNWAALPRMVQEEWNFHR